VVSVLFEQRVAKVLCLRPLTTPSAACQVDIAVLCKSSHMSILSGANTLLLSALYSKILRLRQ
jgi:hypothetical protein